MISEMAITLTSIACALILVIGLPHGMFDYLTLRKMGRGSHWRLAAWTMAYCSIAGVVWLMWQAAPFASLCGFILIAIFHFSEDWSADQSRLGAGAMAISMISLPVLLYPESLSIIFVLIGGDSGGQLADLLLLVAPVFGLVAVANILIDFGSAKVIQGWRNLTLLLAALLLPPGVGFAVYFCLYHSPIHFVEGLETLLENGVHSGQFFLYMSAASAVVVVFVFLAQPFESMDSNLIATTFQTLSILTVPHILLSVFTVSKIRSLVVQRLG
jgi:beta-carotene 15,15'-dioxygenase